MNIKIKIVSLFLVAAAVIPTPIFAATKAGLTPKSPFYFLDTLFERINLALTFNPEKKVTKALLFAEERLAEASINTEDGKLEVIDSLMFNYQANVSLAIGKSKEVKDEKKAEELFNKIANNTAKHQEVLTEVLAKVPEVAKEAIEKALEASKKGHEEALSQIAELNKEIAELKQEIAELKRSQSENKQTAPTPTQKNTEQVMQENKSDPIKTQSNQIMQENKSDPIKTQSNQIMQENKSDPIKTQSNQEDNFWKLIVIENSKFRETARQYKNVISENPYHLQNRIDKIDNKIGIIRNTYSTNATGDAAKFNEMFKILEDSYQHERDYVQNVLNNTNKKLKYFDDMIAYYDGKVNYYIQNSTKFVDMETWLADGNAFYKEGQSDKMFEVMSNGIQDFSNFVDNMKKKDEVYYDAVTLIESSLESYGSSYSSYTPSAPARDYRYYDNIVNDLLSKPSILNPITCNITGGDVLGNQTVTCY